MISYLLILKVGDTFTRVSAEAGDFEAWVRQGVNHPRLPLRVVDPRTEPLPAISEFSGAVVTGSHAMVTERPDWSETLAAWLRTAVEAGLPVLGICYGHQLLAHALGGRVAYHASGIEIGTVPITLAGEATGDPILKGTGVGRAVPSGIHRLHHEGLHPGFEIGADRSRQEPCVHRGDGHARVSANSAEFRDVRR